MKCQLHFLLILFDNIYMYKISVIFLINPFWRFLYYLFPQSPQWLPTWRRSSPTEACTTTAAAPHQCLLPTTTVWGWTSPTPFTCHGRVSYGFLFQVFFHTFFTKIFFFQFFYLFFFSFFFILVDVEIRQKVNVCEWPKKDKILTKIVIYIF